MPNRHILEWHVLPFSPLVEFSSICTLLYLPFLSRTALDTWMDSIHPCWIYHLPKSTMSSTAKPDLHFPVFYSPFCSDNSLEFPSQLLCLFHCFPFQYSSKWWILMSKGHCSPRFSSWFSSWNFMGNLIHTYCFHCQLYNDDPPNLNRQPWSLSWVLQTDISNLLLTRSLEFPEEASKITIQNWYNDLAIPFLGVCVYSIKCIHMFTKRYVLGVSSGLRLCHFLRDFLDTHSKVSALS